MRAGTFKVHQRRRKKRAKNVWVWGGGVLTRKGEGLGGGERKGENKTAGPIFFFECFEKYPYTEKIERFKAERAWGLAGGMELFFCRFS